MNSESKLTEDAVIGLEKSYWDAMKAKDGTRSAKLSGKNSLVTGAQGVASISKESMGKMTEEGTWTLESYSFDDINVIMPTDAVAIIAYTVRQDVIIDGEKKQMKAADSSTWIRGESGWECHAHSETIL